MSAGQFLVVALGGGLAGHFAAKAAIEKQPEWYIMSFVCLLIGFNVV